MFGELIPIGGGDPIPLLKKHLKIGRRESCDICLRFANVSAHHCELTCRDGYWYVKDMNSRNGTKVNGKRVSEKRIDPGDTFTVAKHRYQFTYSPSDLGAVGPPPPEVNNDLDGILGKSLLERAGLDRKPGTGSNVPERYDLSADKGGRFRDPNEPI